MDLLVVLPALSPPPSPPSAALCSSWHDSAQFPLGFHQWRIHLRGSGYWTLSLVWARGGGGLFSLLHISPAFIFSVCLPIIIKRELYWEGKYQHGRCQSRWIINLSLSLCLALSLSFCFLTLCLCVSLSLSFSLSRPLCCVWPSPPIQVSVPSFLNWTGQKDTSFLCDMITQCQL